MYDLDRLCKHRSGRDKADLRGQTGVRAFQRIGRNDELQRALFDLLNPLGGEHVVRQRREHMVCALLFQAAGYVHQRSAGDRKIVYHEAVLARDFADNLKDLRVLIVTRSHFIADRHGAAELRRVFSCAFRASSIRGDDDQIVIDESLTADILAKKGFCIQVVDRNLEKALYLRRMKIHCNKAVGACGFDAVRADARPNGNAGLVLLVAFGIGKVRRDDRYGVCARALECIDPE